MMQHQTIEDAIHTFCADARWQSEAKRYAIIMPTIERCEDEAWPHLLAHGRLYTAVLNHLNFAIKFKNGARVGLYAANKLFLLNDIHFDDALILDCANRNEIIEQLLIQYNCAQWSMPVPRFGLGDHDDR